jgi:carbamoyltransferase
MHIVGLNDGEINSSAAIVTDGKLIAGCPEERFNRQKRSNAFPARSLQFCLDRCGVSLRDCDAIAQAWNPAAYWIKFNPLISGRRTRREDYFYTVPDNLSSFLGRGPMNWVRMDFSPESEFPPVYYVQHHRCHSANAFFLSEFEEAAILTCDWRGEFESTTFGMGKGLEISVLDTQSVPNSLGMFYGTFTELLGYRPDNDEWKVMALAAFDVDCEEFTRRIRQTIHLGPDGRFEMDQSYYKGAVLDQPNNYTSKLVTLLGGRIGRPGEEPEQWHCQVARAMQIVAEEVGFHFLNYLWQRTHCSNVVVSGGFFMNSVFNGKIIDQSPFERAYVSYAPADVGNSIGAAFYVAHCVLGEQRQTGFNSSYIGPSFSDEEIAASLHRRRITFTHHNDMAAEIARLLAAGEIVAVLNGRMEFGERALGNRSILADPRCREAKDRINAMIKYRESYRPFAPATLLESAQKYFDVPAGYAVPYMEKVCRVHKSFQDVLPAITHVDGSARLQTVSEEQNAFFYRVIVKFGELTGVEVVLNTSFNINNEPIVLSPDDALTTFFNSGLTHLALGNYMISKAAS